MNAREPSIRVTLVRFLVLFLTGLVVWSAVLYLARGIVAFGMGCAIADILACLGAIASQSLDAAFARRSVALTPSQEFAAIRIPPYLVAPHPAFDDAEPAPSIVAVAGPAINRREYAPLPVSLPHRTRARYAS